MVALFEPLNIRPYCVPSTAPASATASPKLSTIARRSSIGWIAPCSANCAMSPGWAIAAMSRFALNRRREQRARLLPPEVNFTVTFGYSSLKPAITASKDSCSGPAHVPMVEMLPVTSSLPPRSYHIVVVASAACGGEREYPDERR